MYLYMCKRIEEKKKIPFLLSFKEDIQFKVLREKEKRFSGPLTEWKK